MIKVPFVDGLDLTGSAPKEVEAKIPEDLPSGDGKEIKTKEKEVPELLPIPEVEDDFILPIPEKP